MVQAYLKLSATYGVEVTGLSADLELVHIPFMPFAADDEI